jgi:DNA repair photolyase
MDEPLPLQRRGRGAAENPPNRFDRLHRVEDPEALDDEELRQVPTEFLRDASRNVLSENDSPDVGFRWSINPYRGCEHGCVYCYARPTHEYLGFSAGLDFETKIVVKHDAPALLERVLQKPSWQPETIVLSGNTDCYQPAERRLRLTRGCLEVLARHRHPAGIITKNALVLRDLDILTAMAGRDLVGVNVSITSLRNEITAAMEPRTSRPAKRLDAVRQLSAAGVPVGVMIAPIIPGLTDQELPAIVAAAAEAGATSVSYIIVRLPGTVQPLFKSWLYRAFPDRADAVWNRIVDIRAGNPGESRFGHRMRGAGPWAEVLETLFETNRRKHGLERRLPPRASHHFRPLTGGQMALFETD